MTQVRKEQIAKAKEMDLLTYLQTCAPDELIRCGAHEYKTREHDSLKISNGLWHWFSHDIGGKTALDYLIHVKKMDFVSAVRELCEENRAFPQPVEKERKPFILPPENRSSAAAAAYLGGRGIDTEIIKQCLSRKILYESGKCCVFVGLDSLGIPRSAFLRGIGGGRKTEAPNSEKRFSFSLQSLKPDCKRVIVCESAIDALSVATLQKRSGGDWTASHFLSLGGTSPLALIQF